jgi:hypothetical protein
LVGWSCGSHTKVTLPLQFRHPGPTFLTLLHPAGHPQNGLKYWSVGQLVGRLVAWSVGQGEVTRTSRCLYLFVTQACPSQPFYALQATPKTALNFGRSVGRSVTRKLCCLFSFVTRARPSRPFYALRATPKSALNFGWLVGRSLTGKSHKRHAASSVSSPGPSLSEPSTPCGSPPKQL